MLKKFMNIFANMNLATKLYLKNVLISTILLIFIYLIFGSYYEEYQGFWHAFFSGSLSPGTPFTHFYFLGYIGISHLYALLYQIFPNFQWMSLIHYSQLILSFALLLSLLDYLLIKKEIKLKVTLLLSMLFFLAIAPDNILLFIYARASYIMCGASLLAIIVFFENKEKIKQHFTLYVLLNVFFLWGTLTRVESAMAALLLLICFAVVWHISIIKTFTPILPAIVMVGLSLALIFIDINTSNQFHKEVEPDIETQFTVRFNVVPVETMETFEDSVKYEAAIKMFWGDPDIITIAYLKSLVAEPASKYFDKNQWDRTKNELSSYFNNFKYYCLLVLLLTFFTCLILLQNNKWQQASLLVLYFIGFIILLTANSYFVKMRDRTVSPFLIIYFASVFLLLIKSINYKKYTFPFLFSILFLGSAIQIYESLYKSRELKEALQINRQILTQLEDCCSDATVMPNPTSMGNITLAFTPFEIFDFSKFDRFYFYEASIQSIIPTYYNYLKKECNCEVRNFSNFYRYVLDQDYPKKVYAVSNEDRMDVGMLYLKTFHNLDIVYQKVEAVDLNENLAMDYYSRRKLYLYEMTLKNDTN